MQMSVGPPEAFRDLRMVAVMHHLAYPGGRIVIDLPGGCTIPVDFVDCDA
jgi:hypothetical protein